MLVSASTIANIKSGGTGEAAGRGVCADRDELREWLSFGNWSNGSAFAIEGTPEAHGRVITLCFVQQGECTDEWLVIKSWPRVGGTWMHLALESISWHYILTRRENGAADYEGLLSRLLAATPEQCRTYSY